MKKICLLQYQLLFLLTAVILKSTHMHMNILNSNFKLKHGYETNSAVLQKLRYWSNLLRFGIGEDSTEVETGVGGGTLGVP